MVTIGNRKLVPFEPQRHTERVMDSETVATGLGCKVGIGRELVIELGLG
jgi:hypothetical protein